MRKRKPKKRIIAPDPRYNDPVVTQFINNMMWQGKKAITFGIFYDAMDKIQEKANDNPHEIWKKALENVKPSIEVRSRRVGGATYQVPVDVRPTRRLALAMRWLVEYARARGEKYMAKRLAGELLDAYNNRGNSIKKKEDVHKMAESNKAFAHYNW